MPPAYVKPYVKRQKNDMADAEGICEAVTRANMRFVPTKTPEQQSRLMLHRTRHLFMRTRMAVFLAMAATLPFAASTQGTRLDQKMARGQRYYSDDRRGGSLKNLIDVGQCPPPRFDYVTRIAAHGRSQPCLSRELCALPVGS
jgi:hypothetical protein